MPDVLAAFGNVKPSGGNDNWMARCPAHEDRKASLSIRHADDGKWLIHCQAGCTTSEVLDRVGLKMSDLFPDNGNGHHRKQEVAAYLYRDADGTPLFEVVRYDPKSFAQRRPNGEWGVKDVKKVLYRLNELQNRQSVFVVEGEKDVDNLVARKIPATCSSGGADKWRDDYAQQLVDAGVKKVAVFPDNDAPGRKHAQQIAESCRAAGIDARIVTLPDVPPKGDVSDYLAKHKGAELAELAKKAFAGTASSNSANAGADAFLKANAGATAFSTATVSVHFERRKFEPRVATSASGFSCQL